MMCVVNFENITLKVTTISLFVIMLFKLFAQVEMYYVGEGCITIKETVFASQLYPSVIAHDVLVHNPLEKEAHIDLKISVSSHLDNIHRYFIKTLQQWIYVVMS